MSELALRPDRSENAIQAYDRLEISGLALRRELGFDEDDKPTDEELTEQALKVIIHTLPSGAASALSQLTGEKVQPIVPVSPQDPGTAEATAEGKTPPPAGQQRQAAPTSSPPASGAGKGQTQGPPGTRGNAPPAPGEAARARFLEQSRTQHMVRYRVPGRTTELLHPQLCNDAEYSCPFTHAVVARRGGARPGTPGVYLCHLDTFGRFVLDGPAPYADTRSFISTLLQEGVGERTVNGRA